MEKMDKANSKVERLEKKISAFWKEENYIEICNLAEETLDEVQASYGTYGENRDFMRQNLRLCYGICNYD